MKKGLFLCMLLPFLLSGDALAGGFRPLPAMNVERLEPTVVQMADGRVLVAGGHRGPEGATRRVEIYNPQTIGWQNAPGMKQARTGATGALLPDGRVLVVGGQEGRQSVWAPLASAEIFDPATASWSTVTSRPLARSYGASHTINGEIFLWGGTDASGMEPQSQIFNPSNNTFRSAGLPRPALLGGETNLATASGAFRIGGRAVGKISAATLRYQTVWQRMPGLLHAREDAAGVVLPSGNLFVAGGWGGGKALRSTEVFLSGRWKAGPRLRTPRLGARMVLSGGKPMLLSGWIGGKSTDRTEVLRGGKWRMGPRMFYARWGASAAQIPGGQILLFGGVGKRGVTRTAEVYDPRLRAPWVDIVSGPSKRTNKRLAKFRLQIDGRGRLECKLDRLHWKQCSLSPRFRVEPGKHTLRVRSRVWKLRSPADSWKWFVR